MDLPIAAPPDDTSIDGQWRLYNKDSLADEVHDHWLDLRKSTPERPAYRLADDQETQGIEFELFIESRFPKVGFLANVLVPVDAHFPDSASPKKVRISGKTLHECGLMSHTKHDVAQDRLFVDMVFVGDGYLKLDLPTFLFETSSMPNPPGQLFGSGDNTSAIEFVGRKDLPRHSKPKPRKPPSPIALWLRFLNVYQSTCGSSGVKRVKRLFT